MTAADEPRRAADQARQAGEVLRDVHGDLVNAMDQVQHTIRGGDQAVDAAVITRWAGAVAETIRATVLIDEIAAHTRLLTGPAVLPDVVVPLTEAAGRTQRCARVVAELRGTAERSERRLRRAARDHPALHAAAARWAVAARRLELLDARLAIGARALDAYLCGVRNGTQHDAPRRDRMAVLLPALRQGDDDATADAARVTRLVTAARAGSGVPASRRPGRNDAHRRWRATGGGRLSWGR